MIIIAYFLLFCPNDIVILATLLHCCHCTIALQKNIISFENTLFCGKFDLFIDQKYLFIDLLHNQLLFAISDIAFLMILPHCCHYITTLQANMISLKNLSFSGNFCLSNDKNIFIYQIIE